VPNLCIPRVFFEGKKAGETYARKSTSSALSQLKSRIGNC
jgi:hypothetical protein